MKRRSFVAGGAAAFSVAVAARHVSERTVADAQSLSVRPNRVAVSQFGTDTAAIQRAVDTLASEVIIDVDVQVTTDIVLRSEQILRFAGGRILVARDAKISKGVLSADGNTGVVLLNPMIDATATPFGVPGIRMLNVTGMQVVGGQLTKANLMLESYDNAIDRRVRIFGTRIDLRGYVATSVYISGLRGVSVKEVTCSGGLEGVAIYNQARSIALEKILSTGHRRDGFLIYAGQDVTHVDCRSHSNGQSGFTTQRDVSGQDSRRASWIGCESWNNVFDGFDIRGSKDVAWKVDTEFLLSNCAAHANGNCGFYVVMAEGTKVHDCRASNNAMQNMFIDGSDNVTVNGFKSIGGSRKITSGPNKSGVLVYNSAKVSLADIIATDNRAGPQLQEFGVAFTGRNPGARLRGGRFTGYSKAPFYADRDVSVEGATIP